MLRSKITTALSIGTLVAAAFGSTAFAATDITISGNGYSSDNTVTVNNASSTSVHQSNNSNVSVLSSNYQSTGGNTASFNTGGGSDITTGDATIHTTIAVGGGVNRASLGCGCSTTNPSVTIRGNGADSDNRVTLNGGTSSTATQRNNNNVWVSSFNTQKSGYNHADFNTGWGGSRIRTGDTDASLHVMVDGGMNILTP